MAFWAYIIQSESSGRYYCGHSSDPNRRLRQHNDPEYRLSKTTKRFEGPWRLIWSQGCQTRGEAMMMEKAIKKRGIRRYLESAQVVESGWQRDPGEPKTNATIFEPVA